MRLARCFLLFLVLVSWLRAADVSPAQPVVPDRKFSLGDFGAKGDGTTLNSDAFAKAIAAVKAANGGTLVVPAGRYLTGPLDLCSGLNLHLESGATILFSPDNALYRNPDGRGFRPLLRGDKLHDVVISGAGTIDGSGSAWWEEALRFKADARAKGMKSDTSPRPNLVGFDSCERVRVEGITLTNSPKFNLVPFRSRDVTVDGISIKNPEDSPNTDGIDPSLVHRMLITRCVIDTGDDNIAIKSGGKAGEGVRDLLITDCTFRAGHGCSFGSETSGSDRNVIVRNCTFDGTDMGVRLKSDRDRGGVVEDILYENLTMKNVGQAIVITSYYPAKLEPKPGLRVEEKPVSPTTPIWRNITIRNITATACTKNAGQLLGLPESPIENLTLENISIEAPAGLRATYVKGITLRKVTIKPAKGEPLLFEDTVSGITKTD